MDGAQRPAPPRARALCLPPLTSRGGGGGGDSGGRGRSSGAGRAGAVRLLSTPQHPDGEGGGVDAQGHFVTTLLVTIRGGQGQSHGSRPAGSEIKKSSQKATPGIVSVFKGEDIF